MKSIFIFLFTVSAAIISFVSNIDHFRFSSSSESTVIKSELILLKGSTDTISIFNENGTLKEQLPYYHDADDTLITPKYLNSIKGYPEGDTIWGNFNGDSIPDTAWVVTSMASHNKCEETQNKKDCKVVIRFSDKRIPKLVMDYSPFISFKNEGDLNGDGRDEIGVLPGWFTSACRSYYVFTLKQNKWMQVCDPITNSLNMREAGLAFIKKDALKTGYAIIRSNYANSNACNCQICNVLEKSVKLK